MFAVASLSRKLVAAPARRLVVVAGLLGSCLGATVFLAGCQRAEPGKAARDPRVIVTTPITQTVMDYQDFTGRLDAVKTVDIRARVSGYVLEAPFKEGDQVKEGELLFQIDPRTYLADLNQAEANLKLAIADRNLQQKNAERARRVYASRASAAEDYETALAAEEKASAAVGAAQAAKERAKLYVDFTRVISPLTGRISRRFVDPGNLITADTTILTSVVTESPMYAYFDVDERTYLDLLESAEAEKSASAAAGLAATGVPVVPPGNHAAKDGAPAAASGAAKRTWFESLHFPVMMRLANEEDSDANKIGFVDFVDNRVVGTTGTVRMRGVFQNWGGLLKAGLFVRIRLPLRSPYPSILIPDEAIQSDQERKFVWVVGHNSDVEYRSVQLGQTLREWRVILPPRKGKEGQEGLSLDDRVIVSGMQRVSKGRRVDAELHPPAAPPDVPLVRMLQKANEPHARNQAPGNRDGNAVRPSSP
jgi:membrane fusion protein, multidrug efflux system